MAKTYAFFDIESCNAGKQYGMPPRDFFRLGQVAFNDGPVALVEDYDEFMSLLESADYLVGHNIHNFDLSVLYGVDSLRPLELAMQRKAIDTFCLAALLNPPPYSYTNKDGHTVYDAAKPERALKWLSLDEQAHQLGLPGKLGNLKELAKKYQPEGTKVADYDYSRIPLSEPLFREYAEGDVIAVRALFFKLMEMQKEQQYDSDYLWREQVVYALSAQITRNGVTVDVPAAEARIAELAKEREEVLTWLVEKYDFPQAGKSPWASAKGKEVIFKVLEDFGITEKTAPDWERTATGNLSLGGQAILDLVDGTSEEAERFGRAVATLKGQRSLAQLALDSMYEDGKAHPDITAVQRSGRTSVTRPGLTVWTARGPGAVEKRYFIADPGDVMVEADFSAADARAVAAMSGDHEFAKRFEPGVDAHDISGVIFFGEEEYFANREELRPKSKGMGHALAYRVGAKKLAATGGLPEHQGYEMLKAYQEAYKFVSRWQDEVTKFGEQNGYVENAWGRRMTVDEGRSFTQSSALLGQSTTREMLFDGLIRIAETDIERIRWVRMLVHDAVVFSIPEGIAEEGAKWCIDKMEALFYPKTRAGFPVMFPMEHGPLDAKDWHSAGH